MMHLIGLFEVQTALTRSDEIDKQQIAVFGHNEDVEHDY